MNSLAQNVVGEFEKGVKSSVDLFLESLSRNPAMIGLAVLMINLGGRYLATDITQYDEKVLNNTFMKKLTIFSISFLSTRDIKFSILIVLIYSILFNPMGLAYKIMKQTQISMNPFRLFRKNDVDLDTMEEEKSISNILIDRIYL